MPEAVSQNLVPWGRTTVFNAPLAMFVNSILGALMLQDIHCMISSRNMRVHADQYDRFWVQLSMKEWHLLYPMKSAASLKHTLDKMAETGVLHMERIGSKRTAPYFTLDYDLLKAHDEEMVRRMFEEGCDVPNEKLVEYGLAHEGCGANITVSWPGKKNEKIAGKSTRNVAATNDSGAETSDNDETTETDEKVANNGDFGKSQEAAPEPLIDFSKGAKESVMNLSGAPAEPLIDFSKGAKESVMNLGAAEGNPGGKFLPGGPVENEPVNRPQEVLSDVMSYYENNIHPFVSVAERDELVFMVNTNPVALVKHAIDVAAEKRLPKPLGYIRGILRNETDKTKWESKESQGKKQFAEKVWMTDEEYKKLIEFYKGDKELTDSRISALSHYKLANGKEYASDYNAILGWEDKKKQREQEAERKRQENAKKKETPEEREAWLKRLRESEAEEDKRLEKLREETRRKNLEEMAKEEERRAQQRKEEEEELERLRQKNWERLTALMDERKIATT